MKPRGGTRVHCLSRNWERRLRKADKAKGRQNDKKLCKQGKDGF